ncbi:MAG: hypothetical protein ACI4C1_00785 [Lachnospiraceae bacterium]
MILFLLKCIGIVLLCILGLIVGLILIVLLVPIRYQAQAALLEEKKVNAAVCIHWFLHLIRVYVKVDKNKPRIYAKVLWFTLFDTLEEKVQEVKEAVKEAAENGVETVKEEAVEFTGPITEVKDEIQEEVQEGIEEVQEELGETIPLEKSQENTLEAEDTAAENSESQSILESDPLLEEKMLEKKPSFFEMLSEKISSIYHTIYDKIMSIIKIIKDTTKTVEEKMKMLEEKWNVVQEIWADKRVRHAFTIVKKQLIGMFRHLKPKKGKIRLHLGIEDVGLLGEISAVSAVFFPTWGEVFQFEPDFEQKVLEGDINIKGRIRLGYFVKMVLAIAVRRDVWYTVKLVLKKLK